MEDLTKEEAERLCRERLIFQSQWREVDNGVVLRVQFLDGGPDTDDLLVFIVEGKEDPVAMPIGGLYRMTMRELESQ